MLCLGSQSQPVWGLMGHIIGARIGPRQLPLLRPLLSALIPPPQIIWTLCWPGTYQSINLSARYGYFPSTSPIFRGATFKRRILTKHRLNTQKIQSDAEFGWDSSYSHFQRWPFCQQTAARIFFNEFLLTIQLSNMKIFSVVLVNAVVETWAWQAAPTAPSACPRRLSARMTSLRSQKVWTEWRRGCPSSGIKLWLVRQ